MRSTRTKIMSIHHTLIWNLDYHEANMVNFNVQGLRYVSWMFKIYQLVYLTKNTVRINKS